jgi:hypothetical protein
MMDIEAVSKIDRVTDHLRDSMSAYAEHIEALEKENPDALPLRAAIIEKTLRDTDLIGVMTMVSGTLQREDLPDEVIAALVRLKMECEAAAASLSSGTPDQ